MHKKNTTKTATKNGRKLNPREFGSNMTRAVTDKNNLTDLGMVAVGVSMYAIVPTLLAKVTKWDISGGKGVFVGLLSGLVAAGFGGGGYAVFAGTVAATITHAWWVHLNGKIVYPTLGRYIWRWDPTAKTLGMQVAPQSLGDGVEMIKLPNGTHVPVYTRPPANLLAATPTTTMSDYKDTLGDYKDTLSDTVAALPSTPDYARELRALSDESSSNSLYAEYDEFM